MVQPGIAVCSTMSIQPTSSFKHPETIVFCKIIFPCLPTRYSTRHGITEPEIDIFEFQTEQRVISNTDYSTRHATRVSYCHSRLVTGWRGICHEFTIKKTAILLIVTPVLCLNTAKTGLLRIYDQEIGGFVDRNPGRDGRVRSGEEVHEES